MRQETNNEMDLLLRRLARQQETSASTDHLDADELSSYAENVLPPAARAGYTEHLAECSRCRDLVVQLSSSAGVVVAQQTAKVSEPSVLRKFLASFFSPMVLRYAVPALGLVVVAAIGFMVSRNEGTNSPIAEVRNQQPAQAPVPASQPQPSASPDKEPSDSYDRVEPAANKAVAQGEAAGRVGAIAPSAPTVTVPAEAPQDTRAKTVEEAPPVTKEAPPPKPTPEVDELKKLEAQGRKQEAAKQTVTIQSEPGKAKRDDRSGVADFAAATPSVARSRAESGIGSAGAAKPMAQTKDAEKDEDEVETRTVAGRRFRRQGGVWVDTAYTSPRRITAEYKRGSEGYRTLVGDEPEIKRIADQLDGEIIIVWKGQVYKIR
ncbi:MAG TPA: zf-HC2 domain-containing protein [Pyrinomonadaceae bacterium]|nr:zf-HC2 domain-containing protein [Pyrinomonadaceae bacterium]